MNNSWKLSILGAVALAASTAVMAIGCTVTTTNTTDDGGTTDDASTTADSASDSATGVDGGAEGGTCAATTTCPIIASSTGVTFDNCGTCDTCQATNCCAVVTTCFAQVDGGSSDCSDLFDCLVACAQADGGDSCSAACKAAHTQAAFDALQAADQCTTNSCNTQCN